MTFETALKEAAEEYFSGKRTQARAKRIFSESFPVLGTGAFKEDVTVTIPGPDLWHRRYGREDSHHWVSEGDNLKHQEAIDERRLIWPKASGKDGLVHLTLQLENGNGRGRPQCELRFDPYLQVPKNKSESPELRAPHAWNGEEQSLTDRVWVVDRNWPGETRLNVSDHGTIRYIWTEGFSRFRRSSREGENERRIPEMVMHLPGDGDKGVSTVTLNVLHKGEEAPDYSKRYHDMYSGTPLGDGSLSAFLKHMEYEVLDELVQ